MRDEDSARDGHQVAYSLRVAGNLGATLSQAFPNLDAQLEGTTTVLTGQLADQSALHGVLALIESLGVELVSVQRLADKSTSSDEYDSSGRSGKFDPAIVD